jgi:16S rRNA (cytosine967-C5)-methyltransferase
VTPVARARAIAARVLERVEADDAFAELALDAELAARPAAARDVALATEIVYGTLRWQRYLDWVLAPHSRRRLDTLDPHVRVLLRMTAYQIVFLERVPAFAAVNDAVTLARGPRARGAPAFVNAVLRSFARRRRMEREPPAPRDPVDALATRCSFPTWLAARWVARYGLDDAHALMQSLNARPTLTLRTNTLKITREALAARLHDGRRPSTPTVYAPEGLMVTAGTGPPAAWPEFRDGLFAIQDEAAMLVSRLLAPGPGETIADACAAPGGKTTHLAQLMENRGRVLALDPQPERLARVVEAATRLGSSIVETLGGTVEAYADQHAATCDAVLVDAPCSNLGVVRRNPEVKWRRRPEDLPASAARQRAILAGAATMVRPDGRLVYATCSLEPEENDDIVRAFLEARPDFVIDAPDSFAPALDPDGVLRCLPHRHGTDGFTAVRFRRRRAPSL